jgi:hypothetical protein
LCAVLDLSISRFTDAPLAPNSTCAADSLKHLVEDFEKRDAGNQYWDNYNGVADALAKMRARAGSESGLLCPESAGKYAALLRPPTDLADVEQIAVYIEFLKDVEQTTAALACAKPGGGEKASSLVACLAEGMLQACTPWLDKKACSDLGTFLAAVSHRFEELYASANLRNAVMCAEQIILNNATDLVHGARRCETWRATHLSAPRAGRLRERGKSQSAQVETEVFDACDELFAPPEQGEQALLGTGKHERDAATFSDAADEGRDARQKRHCAGVGENAGTAPAASV